MVATLLFLSSNPPSTKPLDIEEEGRVIQERIGSALDRRALRFEWKPAARTEDILKGLLKRPAIVHFSGHGLGDVTGARGSLGEADAPTGELLVRDEHGKAVTVPGEALTKLFELLHGTRCVVLNACFSEEQARKLAAHADYVIGTRTAVPDKAAISFSKGFYLAINAGKSLAEAFALGCNQADRDGHKAKELYSAWTREGVDPAKIVLVRPQRSPWVMASIGMAAMATAGIGLYLYTRPITARLMIVDDRGEVMAKQAVELAGGPETWTRSSTTDEVGVASFAGLARSLLGERVRVCVLRQDGERVGTSFLLRRERQIPLCGRYTAYVKPDLPLVLKLVPTDATTTFKLLRTDARAANVPIEKVGTEYPLAPLGDGKATLKIPVRGGFNGYSIQLSQGGENVFHDANARCESGICVYRLELRSGGPCAQGARADDLELIRCP